MSSWNLFAVVMMWTLFDLQTADGYQEPDITRDAWDPRLEASSDSRHAFRPAMTLPISSGRTVHRSSISKRFSDLSISQDLRVLAEMLSKERESRRRNSLVNLRSKLRKLGKRDVTYAEGETPRKDNLAAIAEGLRKLGSGKALPTKVDKKDANDKHEGEADREIAFLNIGGRLYKLGNRRSSADTDSDGKLPKEDFIQIGSPVSSLGDSEEMGKLPNNDEISEKDGMTDFGLQTADDKGSSTLQKTEIPQKNTYTSMASLLRNFVKDNFGDEISMQKDHPSPKTGTSATEISDSETVAESNEDTLLAEFAEYKKLMNEFKSMLETEREHYKYLNYLLEK